MIRLKMDEKGKLGTDSFFLRPCRTDKRMSHRQTNLMRQNELNATLIGQKIL